MRGAQAPGQRVLIPPLIILAHQGAPQVTKKPRRTLVDVAQGSRGWALPSRGSSLTHVEVIAGSQASTESAGVMGEHCQKVGSSLLFCCLGS